MRFPIPDAALDDRLAVVGTAGSGKTYLVLGAIEHLLARRSRVIGIDPLGVMWGLRLMADGKTPSPFQPVIFGGTHGDLPINEHAGALIGEAVATSRDSCIIDLSQLGTKAAERRFMLAFLTALYRHTDKEPVHLVVDEADMFAPQKLLDKDGDAAKLLGMMETIVRRGRVKGFIPWLLTQRPAVLSKDVLSQADGIVALKLTAKQDHDAIGGWIEATADKGQWQTIRAALPAKQRGEGVIWIPARGILKEVTFPKKETFDSSRTPKRGERIKAATLRPIDLGALKDRLAAVEAEAKANDPRALKSEVSSLRATVAKLERNASNESTKINTASADAINGAHQEGYQIGYAEGWRAGWKTGHAAGAEKQMEELENVPLTFTPDAPSPPTVGKIQRKIIPQNIPAAIDHPVERRASNAKAASSSLAGRPNGSAETLSGPQRQLLSSLAWWARMGHDAPTREQIAAIAGWKITGGHLKNVIGSLRTKGLVAYPSQGTVSLTAEGEAMAPEPDMGRTLHDGLRGVLSGPQRQMFDVLLHAPRKQMPRSDIAIQCGWDPNAGHLKNVIGSLRTLHVIDYPAPGEVALQDWVNA